MNAAITAVGRALARGFNRLGLELVSSAWAFRAGLRPDLHQLTRRKQPGTIFDVGANTGRFRDFLRRSVRYKGDIVSFEPIPSLGDQLRASAKTDPRWKIESVALGAVAGDFDLNVSSRSDFSSFLETSAAGAALFPMSKRENTVRVPVIRLDDYVGRTTPERPYILKLDTQGFDSEVLKGAEETLRDCVAVLSEVSVIPVYQDQPDWMSAIAELNRRGFELAGLYPVTRTKSLQVIEFDCLTVRTNA